MSNAAVLVVHSNAELATSAKRWKEEIRSSGTRSTLWFGIMGKCSHLVDSTIRGVVDVMVPLAGDAGNLAFEKTANGKSKDRLTLGQRVKLLEQIYPEVNRYFSKSQGQEPPLGRRSRELLNKIARARNDLAGHPDEHLVNSAGEALKYLDLLLELSESPLMKAIEQLGANSLKGTGDDTAV